MIVRHLWRFGLSSLAGLVIDLGGFWLLDHLGVVAWLANVISSAASITAVYFLATRYTFGMRPHPATYAVFFAWYAIMIAATSLAIGLIVHATDWPDFDVKLGTVPFSFTLNFLFSRTLFARWLRHEQHRDAAASAGQSA